MVSLPLILLQLAVFVPSANNVEIKDNDVKTDLASENLDKGKSILGAPPK